MILEHKCYDEQQDLELIQVHDFSIIHACCRQTLTSTLQKKTLLVIEKLPAHSQQKLFERSGSTQTLLQANWMVPKRTKRWTCSTNEHYNCAILTHYYDSTKPSIGSCAVKRTPQLLLFLSRFWKVSQTINMYTCKKKKPICRFYAFWNLAVIKYRTCKHECTTFLLLTSYNGMTCLH